MNWPPIIARVVRVFLRRMREIRLEMATLHPASTQAVARKRKGAEITTHRLLQAEVYGATGQHYQIKRYT